MSTGLLRCSWTAALLFAGLVAGAHAEQARRWDFRVYLNDDAIGHHRFALKRDGAFAELKSDARFDVRVLFFNAYRYAHQATERWQGNCLEALQSRTDDNGKQLSVSLSGRELDGCLMSYAYWNRDILRQGRLLNAQTGAIDPIKVARVGEERIQARGESMPATRYRISGPKHPIDLWYSSAGEWLALESTLEGGRRLRYRLESEESK
jgi:hypothetical protein